MGPWWQKSLYSLTSFTLVSFVIALESSTVSINNAPDFTLLRQCAACWLNGCAGDINDFLGCNHLNSCFCRTDLSVQATSFLSSVINAKCIPGPASNDITSAQSIYSRYCATANELATASTTSPGPSASSNPATPTSTVAPSTSTIVVSHTESPVTSTTLKVSIVMPRAYHRDECGPNQVALASIGLRPYRALLLIIRSHTL
jgi:hypothetical protein